MGRVLVTTNISVIFMLLVDQLGGRSSIYLFITKKIFSKHCHCFNSERFYGTSTKQAL